MAGAGLHAKNQQPTNVLYKGEVVGNDLADILVEEAVVAEPEAVEVLIQEHEAQLINYPKATNVEAGLLLNFAKITLLSLV